MSSYRFYKGKNVLITGHTGFVGSWLTLWLTNAGANVTGFSIDTPTKPSHYRYLHIDNDIIDVKGDIRKFEDTYNAVRDANPDIVFHLAAKPILLESYERPLDTCNVNTFGSLNVLESVRKVGGIKALLNVTTDKVYENLGYKKRYKETDRFGGHDVYSASKACSEILTNAYRESFFEDIGVATSRAGNIIGGGDWGEHRLVTDIINAHFDTKKLVLRYPEAIRPWTYLLDVLEGYTSLVEKLYRSPKSISGGWNFSSNSVKTVIEVVKEFDKHIRLGYKVESGKMYEDNVLLLDSTKARTELGWKPRTGFADMIRDTANWYTYFYKKREDIREYSTDMITEFCRRI